MDLRKYQQEFVNAELAKPPRRMLGVTFDKGISKVEASYLTDKTLHTGQEEELETRSKVRYV